MDYNVFIDEKVKEIKKEVGGNTAFNALSGGVDSSAVTMLGHKALGEKLKTCFIENGLMRKNEAGKIQEVFKDLGVNVEIVDAKKEFLSALKGLTDPEEKRQAITNTFYAEVFSKLVKKIGAKYLFHGTILTDIEETVAGIKRQHNILEQVGIDPQKEYGYKVIEPLKELRKDGVRQLAKVLGLPGYIAERIPFPGPALAARIVGEVTEEKLELVREATAIVEDELAGSGAFQYLAVLLNDRATGIRNGKREFGNIIVVRCINSKDARTATVTELPWAKLHSITEKITQIKGVNRVCYDLTPKPPATVEYI
ncbi:MAG: asparagine synthase-related protein [Candidatus Omnitrophota bacterium]